ncbi:MAG: isopentenyl-diphosphate Delta-isomerase [Salibacteraceae bacterium]
MIDAEEKVILVDESDRPLGTMDKLEAHRQGVLHRAFSVFVFNEQNELLLQQRAHHKYHSGGLWTNTCCSHPRPGEEVMDAAHRRLVEEMGFDCPIEFKFSFIYKKVLDNELTEHELDHVLVGQFSDAPEVNPDEVGGWRYVDLETLMKEINLYPERFTEWFKLSIDRVVNVAKPA